MSNLVPTLIKEIEACKGQITLHQFLSALYEQQLALAVQSMKLACGLQAAQPLVKEDWAKFESTRHLHEIAMILHRLTTAKKSVTDFVLALKHAATAEQALSALADQIHIRHNGPSLN